MAPEESKFYILHKTSDMPTRPGQAFILILLVMSIALTLGVSVASRSIAALRQISFSAQSAKALAFAEAGAEEALKCLADGSCSIPYNPPAFDLDGDGQDDFDYQITALDGDSLPRVGRDTTLEVDLNGYSPAASIVVCWSDVNVSAEQDTAMAIAFVRLDAGSYTIQRWSYDPVATRRADNGFLAPSVGSLVGCSGYRYGVSIPPFSGTPVAMRLRPLYSGPVSLAVKKAVGANLPSQGSRIESAGFSGKVRRKVEVARTNPALSEIFDFVLFSGSESSPLTK